MKKLIDDCKDHDYIYLRRESVLVSSQPRRIVEKEVYACVLCGTGLDVYELDNAITLKEAA